MSWMFAALKEHATDRTWFSDRTHLAPLVSKIKALLELADGMVRQCCASGESVDYTAFEEQVAAQEVEVHQTTLASLDIGAPFV